MANMVIPNEGKLLWLDRALDLTDADTRGLEVVLYTNDYTPIDASVFTNFDAATFAGSAPFPVDWGDWPSPVIVANVAVSTLVVAPNWTCTGGGPEDCYGWVMYGVDTQKVYATQRFAAVRTMATGAKEELDPFAIKLKTFA